MGFFKKVKKAFKKVVKGIGKVFKAVGKVVKKVGQALKSGFKKLTSSTLGKVLLAVAAIYVGGALYGMYGKSAVIGQGKTAWDVGTAFSNAKIGVSELGKTVLGKDATVADKAVAETTKQAGKTAAEATFESTVGEAGKSAAQEAGKNAVQEAGRQAVEEEAKKGILSNVWDKTKDVAGSVKDWAGDNELLAYSLVQTGGSALASMNAPDEEDLLQKQYDLRQQEQQRLIDNNIVPNISPGLLGAYKYRAPADAATDVNVSSMGAPKAPMRGLLSRSEYV